MTLNVNGIMTLRKQRLAWFGYSVDLLFEQRDGVYLMINMALCSLTIINV